MVQHFYHFKNLHHTKKKSVHYSLAETPYVVSPLEYFPSAPMMDLFMEGKDARVRAHRNGDNGDARRLEQMEKGFGRCLAP
jgi:hypothetical protein